MNLTISATPSSIENIDYLRLTIWTKLSGQNCLNKIIWTKLSGQNYLDKIVLAKLSKDMISRIYHDYRVTGCKLDSPNP